MSLVNERIAMLFDEGSFTEVGAAVVSRTVTFGETPTNVKGDGVVTGYGTVDGRLVYAYAQNPDVLGGTLGEAHAEKIVRLLQTAEKTGAPVVALLDSKGARLKEGYDAIAGYSKITAAQAKLKGIVPLIAVVLGGCYGSQGVLAAMADVVVRAQKGKLFAVTPTVLESSGVDVQNYTPKVDLDVDSDQTAIAKTKAVLAYLPSNYLDDKAYSICEDDLNRETLGIENATATEIAQQIADNNSTLQIGASPLTYLARFDGIPTGIVALEGELTFGAIKQIARTVKLCDAFDLPIVTLVNTSGYAVNSCSANIGLLDATAELATIYATTKVPKVTVVTHKAYGVGNLLCGKNVADTVYAWTDAAIATLPPETAVNVLFSKEIATSTDPAATREKLFKQYETEFMGTTAAAQKGYIDDVIASTQTRRQVAAALLALQTKRG